MKKRKSETNDGESKSSKLLFNKTEHLVKKLKPTENYEELKDTDKKPAWVDEDDGQFEGPTASNVRNNKNKPLYKDKLKQKYETLVGTPGWAKLETKDENETNDEILRTVGHLQKKKDKYNLSQHVLDLKRLTKINGSTRNEGTTISCIEFHPTASVALVAGTSGAVSLFSIGRETNKLHNFRTSELTGREPVPLKTVSNLRTAITHLKFNPTTEILSVASKMYPNAVKMVHIPSYHVFKNVPEHDFDLNNVVTVNFSPNSGYMGLGNDMGAAYLYRLKHYKNY
ncbi:U3 small nucleolar RNA-associated protein 18-like protein [Operophtera brumata]|uniref:U3 small nucleolar RNA-associated protein 18-like protein n=1 Tax=Operophtera brumata TaxID=104452 RepID=A0A0L7K5U5_OPEBR|nr:U3 small nucleolar RNA-associated protein 18-like protein [Operophtera brumata]